MLETADVECYGVQLYNNKGSSQQLMSSGFVGEERTGCIILGLWGHSLCLDLALSYVNL